MGKVQHATAQAEQQQLADPSVVVIVERDLIAGRFPAVTEALRQRQRGDDLEGRRRRSLCRTNDVNLSDFRQQQVNGSEFSLPPAFDMKAFKADILKEMRSEITKAKNEIIDGECLCSCSSHFRAKLLCVRRRRVTSRWT